MSKYDKLEQYLRNSQNQIETLNYGDIEKILGTKLPDSARNYRPWWANGGHTQANAWLNVGWRVKSVILEKSITFEKTGKKEYTQQIEKTKIETIPSAETVRISNNEILVDGSNVAWASKKEGKPKIDNIEIIRLELKKQGYVPIIIVDASLRHHISESDKKTFEIWINEEKVIQSPAGIRGDNTLLEYADRKKLKIVSNDTFKQYKTKYSWLEGVDRLIPFNIIGSDAIILYREQKAVE